MLNKLFFLNPIFCRIMWKSIVERGSQRRQCGTCALHAGYLKLQIHTHTLYVIFIAFPLQHLFHEDAPLLCYTYVVCLFHILERQLIRNDRCTRTKNFPVSPYPSGNPY